MRNEAEAEAKEIKQYRMRTNGIGKSLYTNPSQNTRTKKKKHTHSQQNNSAFTLCVFFVVVSFILN